MKKSEILLGALRLPVDLAAIAGAFMLAYYLRPITDLIPGVQYQFLQEQLPPLGEYLQLTAGASVFLLILFAWNNLYSLKVTHRFLEEFFRIVFLTTVWILFIIAFYFLIVHQLFFSRIALVHIWAFTIFFVTLGRLSILLLQEIMLYFGYGKRRVLFVGAGLLGDSFYNILKEMNSYKVIGAVDEARQSRKLGTLQIIGTLNELDRLVTKYDVEEIIQVAPDMTEADSLELLNFCKSRQIGYHFIPDLLKLQRTNVEVSMYGDIPLVSLKEGALDGWGYVFKRLFDAVFSLLAITLLLPLWVVIAVAIKLDSRGPIVYWSGRQYRDRVFYMYKFRSMVSDADKTREKLLEKSERSGPLFKMKNDPRITRFGRFLRKTSLDELPQLFNVLKGDMSLVGPRPHLPEEVAKYAEHHYRVFAIKPGMTGLAQISGRSRLDFEEEVKLDLYYIENWSLWMDLKIILKSVGVIFRADGE